MVPALALGLIAAAGAGGYLYFRNKGVAGQAPGQPAGMVSELTQGKTYACQLAVNKTIHTTDAATASSMIKSDMEKAGFKVLSAPAVRNEQEMSHFLAGSPSIWIMNGQWTKAEKTTQNAPAWLDMATFYSLPVN